MKQKKIIGLIGGMGPYASAYFYTLLLDKSGQNYGAKNNDDFPEVLLDSVPVPDFISDKSHLPEAREMLIKRVKRLAEMGAEQVAMICNTGHILADDLTQASGGKFISMIDLVALEAKKRGYHRVGVLTTPMTKKMGLYTNCLNKAEVVCVHINGKIQEKHEQIIREVVAGNINKSHGQLLYRMAKKFTFENKLDGIILGCTELPLVFPKNKLQNTIDCMEVLADELLFRYYSNGETYG